MEPENNDMPIMSANIEDISELNENTAYVFTELNEAFYKSPYKSMKENIIDSAKKEMAPGNLIVNLAENLGTVSMGGST